MTEEEVINLLRIYKKEQGKLEILKIERRRKEIKYDKLLSEYNIRLSPIYEEGSKSTRSDSNVEIAVINKIEVVDEVLKEIEKIDKEIEILELDLKEINVRLGVLTRVEKEILVARFVDNMTLEEIGCETYYQIRQQTRSARTIKNIIKNALDKIAKM